jgi:hypothetical protein
MTDYPYARFSMPRQYAPSDTGAPLGGARLYFYASGTTIPQDTYADDALTITNTNPVEADQYGLFPDIFLAQLQYRVVLTTQGGDEVWTSDPVAPYIPEGLASSANVAIQLCADSGGTAMPTGLAGDLFIPFNCVITAAVLQASQTGSLVMDIWAAPFVVNTPPTILNSICATGFPTLAGQQSSIDVTLTGWTTTIPAGTALRYNINSVSGIFRFTLTLVAGLVL